MEIDDLNNDGKPDLVIAGRGHMEFRTFLNTTPGAFAPFLFGSTAAGGRAGKPFRFQVNVTGTPPVELAAERLPAGLSLNGRVIRGVPQEAGVTLVTVTASNAAGTAKGRLHIRIHGP